jgi:polyferredoxin
MDKVERPRGLIAYDTDAAVAARCAGQKPQHKLVRPRTLYYAGALVLVGGLMIQGFRTREEIGIHALRDRNPAYVQLQDGSVRNGYTLKIANHGFETASIEIRYSGIPGAVLNSPGQPAGNPLVVQVEPNRVTPLRVFITAPSDEDEDGSEDAAFTIRSNDRTLVVPTAFDYGSSPE